MTQDQLRIMAQGLVAQIRARDRKGFSLTFEASVKVLVEALAEMLNKTLDKDLGT